MYNILIGNVGGLNNVFLLHPDVVRNYLEGMWSEGSQAWNLPALNLAAPQKPPAVFPSAGPNLSWYHLIYSYLIENTKVVDIFERVIHEYTSGERLDTPNSDAANWLRATEALFYRHPAGTAIYNVESSIRPDGAAVRRNAYFRMFGSDLNHGKGGSTAPYEFPKPDASNRDFVATFERFLREAWIGIENRNNLVGANPTDDSAIATQCERLFNMLNARRRGWNLAREEFYSVALLNWLHIPLNDNTPIIVSLKAEGAHPRDRLNRVAQRVGMSASRFSFEYFEMAVAASNILHLIETGLMNNIANVPAFYLTQVLRDDVSALATHWSAASGRNLRVRETATAGA
jgi:hypothetical protein